MNHETYQERLSALLDGELDDAERAETLAHLDGCADCRAYFAELAALHEALAEPEELEPPADFAAGVMARLHGEAAPKKTKVLYFRRGWAALAACAAVAALALLPGVLRGEVKTARADESYAVMSSAAQGIAPAAPVAPPIPAVESAARAAATEETPAAPAAASAAPVAPTAPVEPTAPAGASGGSGDTGAGVMAEAGVPVSVVTTGPNGETLPQAPAAEAETHDTARNEPAEKSAAPLLLSGAGAAAWLQEHGEPAGDGVWRVRAEELGALPAGLTLAGDADADADGFVSVAPGEEAAP